MTVSLLETGTGPTPRRARRCRFLMCPPRHFTVSYVINPWMDPSRPVDTARAVRQWTALVDTYRDLGHTVDLVAPVPGLPDLVFTANSAVVLDGRALTARFRHAERMPEQAVQRTWFAGLGVDDRHAARAINEGEGDFLVAGDVVLAGWGFRTSRAAHAELQEHFGRPVVSLELVDPRFYHLDTALCVLDARTVAYHPPALSPGSRRVVERLFPEVVEVGEADACRFALNAVSDGAHVVLPVGARAMAADLATRGFVPVPVDVSELAKAGGAMKCATLELHG